MLQAMDKVPKDEIKVQQICDYTRDVCFSSNVWMHKTRKSSLFNLPGLFVGFSVKGLSDTDVVRSPTSPLDYKGFSNLSDHFISSTRFVNNENPKSWECGKVGLSLVDILNDEHKPGAKFLGLSERKNILFGQKIRMNISSSKSHLVGLRGGSTCAAPKSLPKDYGIYKPQLGNSRMYTQSKLNQPEITDFGLLRSFSAEVSRCPCNPKLDSEAFLSESISSTSDPYDLAQGGGYFDKFSASLPVSIDSSSELLSASEIEQSEDYTCIISHGPNPKTTHIFGDRILEGHNFPSQDFKNKHRKELELSACQVKPFDDSLPSTSSNDFLSFCFSCKKKLEQGNHMYRVEKAFCSISCCKQEILIQQEMENPISDSSNYSGSLGSSFHEEVFEAML